MYAQDAEWMERELEEIRPSDIRVELQDPAGFALASSGPGPQLEKEDPGCRDRGRLRVCAQKAGLFTVVAALDRTPDLQISTAELTKALKEASVVLLDARPQEEFAKSHIPGAIAVRGVPGLSASKYTADAAEVRRLVPDRSRRLVVYCNGLHCGRSKRFAADLRKLGYTNLSRYQLGVPAWKALGEVTQLEKDALLALVASDSTAVLIDAGDASDAAPRLALAKWIPPVEAPKAKDDGRLPMTDHNTRIFIVGDKAAQARAGAEAIVRDAFHNVSFYAGSVTELAALHAREGHRR